MGTVFLSEDAIATLKTKLLPLATVITPNLPEAEALTGMKIETKQDIYTACQQLYGLGAKNVLLKGGHSLGNPNDLFFDGENFQWLKAERIPTKNTMDRLHPLFSNCSQSSQWTFTRDSMKQLSLILLKQFGIVFRLVTAMDLFIIFMHLTNRRNHQCDNKFPLYFQP